MKITIIGLGGIGGNLVDPLSRYVAHAHPGCRIKLVDGDVIEAKNRSRQQAGSGNKAEWWGAYAASAFPELAVKVHPEFASSKNLPYLVTEGDIVFLAVDNHATRKLVSDHCCTLENVLLISGGNERSDGNVQVYLRKDGHDATPSLVTGHPEIAEPDDRLPGVGGCEEAITAGERQLIFTNLMIAAWMLSVFWSVVEETLQAPHEIFVDIATLAVRTVKPKR